jgi:hypothetical protein
VLGDRRRNEKRRSDAETAALERHQAKERYRQQKIYAGYVILAAVQLNNIEYSDCMLVFSPLQLPRAHTYVYSLESACI